ncbi:hypothetical protein M0R45_016250 [Rubus argutus]|uniref:Uncharacterized protein n=1 Tax=Rubus argutus TaxID=59490 RepID=A0AAW1XSU2_RUBAR
MATTTRTNLQKLKINKNPTCNSHQLPAILLKINNQIIHRSQNYQAPPLHRPHGLHQILTTSNHNHQPDAVSHAQLVVALSPFDLYLNLFKRSPPAQKPKLAASLSSSNPSIKSAPPRTQSHRKSQITAVVRDPVLSPPSSRDLLCPSSTAQQPPSLLHPSLSYQRRRTDGKGRN